MSGTKIARIIRKCSRDSFVRTVAYAAVLCALVYGCGVDEGSPPTISHIVYSPSLALVGFNNGMLTMVGTVDVSDPDSDLAFIRVETQVCGRGAWSYLDKRLSAPAHGSSGTVQFVALVSTDCPEGTYVVKVSVFDGAGHQSNELYAPITLTTEWP